jgi:hypothetical protein
MLFAARVLLLCVIAASGSLGNVLDRMRAQNGGLWNAHISSTSAHVMSGIPGILRTDVQGLRFVLSQCIGEVCLGTYFDGNRLFSVNINDTALPSADARDPYLRALRILGTLAFLAPDFEQNGGRIMDDGWTTFAGKRCRELELDAPLAASMIVFVDPDSGLVAGAKDASGEHKYAMRDYRRVGSYMLPFEIDMDGAPIDTYITRSVVDAPLRVPAGLTPEFLGNPAMMQLDPQSITPTGMCTIAGIQVHCLIDTGNSALSMSSQLAERLALEPIGMLQVAGLGNYATGVVEAGPLQVGNVRFGKAKYIVLGDIERYGYDLILGADVLANMPVTFDYAKHALYFGAQDSAGATGATVPLRFENFVPVVDVTLGSLATALAVDTGDQSTVNLSYDYYRQHASLFTPTLRRNVGGVGKQCEELEGRIALLRIGSLFSENQSIGTTECLNATADGHLGSAFLDQYRVTLDYPHQLFTLLPASQN